MMSSGIYRGRSLHRVNDRRLIFQDGVAQNGLNAFKSRKKCKATCDLFATVLTIQFKWRHSCR